jgi:hypothetical protein
MSSHIADRAGFLAALSPDDPERITAEEHVRSCAACRDAFDEGHRLIALLGAAVPLDAPSPELVRRAAAAIEDEISSERRAARLLRWCGAGTVALVWALQLAYGHDKMRLDARSLPISLCVLGVALVAVTFVDRQRRLAIGTMLVTSALFAYLVGELPELDARAGVECTLCEVVAAAIPWFLVSSFAKWKHILLDRATTVAVAVAGALASQAAQRLTCVAPHANPHLLVFHLGGVLLAFALGAVNLTAGSSLAGSI